MPLAHGPLRRLRISSSRLRLALSYSVLGRLSNGVVPIAIVLVAHERTGSFALAGLAAAAYAAGAGLASPLGGRLALRLRQSRLVAGTTVAHTAALVALALGHPHALAGKVTLAVSLAAGLTRPPLAPLSRSLFRDLAAGPGDVAVALAVDAAATEGIYIVGPLVVSAATAVATPSAALGVGAAATLAGGLLYARLAARAAPPLGGGERRPASALRTHAVRILVGSAVLVGCGFGMLEVTVPALAVRSGTPASAGLPLALLAAGTLLGSVAAAAFAGIDRLRVLLVGLAAYVLLLAPLAAVSSLLAVGIALAAAGLALGPLTVATLQLVDELAPRSVAAEAFGWLTTANVVGSAIGAAVAGLAVAKFGVRASFGAADAAALAAALVAFSLRSSISRAPATSAPTRASSPRAR